MIINDDLYDEFNKFKSKLSSSHSSSLDGTCSVVEGMVLLMFWCTSSKISTKPLACTRENLLSHVCIRSR